MESSRETILIVDDTAINRMMLTDILQDEYNILEAADGVEAISLLSKYEREISLVLLDIVMPNMDGYEVLAVMNRSKRIPGLPVITISAETSSTYIDHAYDLGATECINRPFDERTVLRRIKNVMMLYNKQKMLQNLVAEQIFDKEKNNFAMVEILSNIVEFRNAESGLHVMHIRVITEMLLRELRETNMYTFSRGEESLIVNASALHDIGKISIANEILNKPGKLTDAEFEVIKTHSVIGAQILDRTPSGENEKLIRTAREICMWHHERYDGKGYPDGLLGEQIPISAQVVALADVYDALTSTRVYKPAFSHDEAIKMIFAGECGEFNPILLQGLLKISDKIGRELVLNSVGADKLDTDRITAEITTSANLQIPSRALDLYEIEKTKCHFLSQTSREVQFEYNDASDFLQLCEWGAKKLGLEELIVHPESNEDVMACLQADEYRELKRKLRVSTPLEPVINTTTVLVVHGMPRRYQLIARSLWNNDYLPEYVGAIGKFVDVPEESLEFEIFERVSEQDLLTGLLNKKTVSKLVRSAIGNQSQKRYILILYSVDELVAVNSKYGYAFGDSLLRHVAKTTLQYTGRGDFAARVGGDEFLIFSEAQDVPEEQLQHLFQMLTAQYKSYPVTVSMGVAIYPNDGNTYSELFRRAGRALRDAKSGGGHRYYFFGTTSGAGSDYNP